jgi:hypothetical protein
VKIEHVTSSRFVAQIGKLRAVVGQFLPLAKRANPSKCKFLDAVTRPKIGGAEFSYLLDQSGQTRCHLWFPSLIIDKWGYVHIDQEPLRLRTLPRALEGSIDVLMNAVTVK